MFDGRRVLIHVATTVADVREQPFTTTVIHIYEGCSKFPLH